MACRSDRHESGVDEYQDDGLCWSAVVITFNGGEKVVECVRRVLGQDTPPVEVVVVDSASTDGSGEGLKAAFPFVRVIEVENRGPSTARNVGLRWLSTDLALLIDHDMYLAKDAVRHLARARKKHSATISCPRIRLIPERDIVQADGAEVHFTGTLALRNGFTETADEGDESTLVGAAPGGCLFVDRRAALAAGGFDELYFFYLEDLEFSLRLRAMGHRFAWGPAALVYHDRGTGTTGLAFRGRGAYPTRRAYFTCRNRILTILIHFRLRTILVLLPLLIAYEGASLALAVSRAWLPTWARAWIWQARHLPEIRARRRLVQRTRIVPDRDVLTGGPIPLAPGLVQSRSTMRAIDALSTVLDAYWRFARRLIG